VRQRADVGTAFRRGADPLLSGSQAGGCRADGLRSRLAVCFGRPVPVAGCARRPGARQPIEPVGNGFGDPSGLASRPGLAWQLETPIRARMQHGRYFEDFTVGEVIKHWPGRTIREFDDTWFTLMTMNTNPLHFDEHYASQTQHGRCLVNGTLVFAIAVGMSVRDISMNAIANLEYESVKHLGPTFHGDTIYAETEILDKTESKSKPDRGVIYVETRAWNQRNEPVLSLRRRVLIPKRPAK
jgi:acyl dehydratase